MISFHEACFQLRQLASVTHEPPAKRLKIDHGRWTISSELIATNEATALKIVSLVKAHPSLIAYPLSYADLTTLAENLSFEVDPKKWKELKEIVKHPTTKLNGIPFNTALLAYRTDYFKASLHFNMENSQDITLDHSLEEINLVLQFLESEDPSLITSENAWSLYRLALYLQTHTLIDHCELVLEDWIHAADLNNPKDLDFLFVIYIHTAHGTRGLMKACQEKFQTYFELLFFDPNFSTVHWVKIKNTLAKEHLPLELDFSNSAISFKELNFLLDLQIDYLGLTNCSYISTKGSFLLTSENFHLKRVDLSVNDWVDDTLCNVLAKKGNLEILILDNCPNITIEAIRNLPQTMKELSLSKCEITNEWMEPICQLSNLEKLWLNDESITDEIAPFLQNMKKLKFLDLSRATVTDLICTTLSTLPLKELWLDYNQSITDEGFIELSKISTLKKLHLSCCNITGEGLVTFTTLSYIDLSGCERVTALALNDFVSKSALKSLVYPQLSLKKSIVPKLTNIKSLDLGFPQGNLKRLESLKRLKSLRIIEINNERCKALSNLPLEELSISGSVDSIGLKSLENMPNLTSLKLEQMSINNKKIAVIGSMNLDHLSLIDCNINEFCSMKPLKNLKTLTISPGFFNEDHNWLRSQGVSVQYV